MMEKPKTSEAKRRANDKWDKKNMAILSCKIKKDEALAFKIYAGKLGKTSNALLKEYVFKCIGVKKEAELKTHYESRNESFHDFVSRAIDETVKRDLAADARAARKAKKKKPTAMDGVPLEDGDCVVTCRELVIRENAENAV